MLKLKLIDVEKENITGNNNLKKLFSCIEKFEKIIPKAINGYLGSFK